MLEKIRQFVSVPTFTYITKSYWKPPVRETALQPTLPGPEEESIQNNLFMTPKNLTFPGVTVVAGTIANFIGAQLNISTLIISAVVAVLFGGFMIWIGITDPQSLASSDKRERRIAIGVGVINTLLLMITIYGIANVDIGAGDVPKAES